MTLVIGIIVAAAIGYGWWRLSLHMHPYARCLWCRRGRRGQNRGSGDRVWGNCKHCGGSGKRLRWGAREQLDLRRAQRPEQ